MTGYGCVRKAMCREDRITTAPAESDCADLSCSWQGLDVSDELVDNRFRDGFAVLDSPGPECRSNIGGIFSFIRE
jgi:hypothetical protein